MRWFSLLSMAACIGGAPATALAKSDKTLEYRYNDVWSAAIRMIRADRGYALKDKDRANGYIIFVHPGSGAVKECMAALEIFPFTDDQGYRRIRAKLSIEHQPSYVEVHLLDTLEQKLRDELGSPPRPERSPGQNGSAKEPAPPKK